MKVIAFVPIKMNNERLPGKNVKPFSDGTSILEMILGKLNAVKDIDEIYVFCSDESIKKYLPSNVKFLSREKHLDTSSATSQDIISSFMSKVDSDIYLLAHATSPFVKSSSIEKCIAMIKEYDYDSAFTAYKLQKLLWCENEPMNFDAANIPRTQDLVPIYEEVSAAYVFKKETFEKYNRRIGVKPYICNVGLIESIDIDNYEDFELANCIYINMLKREQ